MFQSIDVFKGYPAGFCSLALGLCLSIQGEAAPRTNNTTQAAVTIQGASTGRSYNTTTKPQVQRSTNATKSTVQRSSNATQSTVGRSYNTTQQPRKVTHPSSTTQLPYVNTTNTSGNRTTTETIGTAAGGFTTAAIAGYTLGGLGLTALIADYCLVGVGNYKKMITYKFLKECKNIFCCSTSDLSDYEKSERIPLERDK